MNIYQYFGRWKESEGTALHVDERSYTYRELEAELNATAALLNGVKEAFVGVLAHRSMRAFASILAVLKAGKAYVPLNPGFPPARNLQIIKAAGLRTVIVGNEGETMLSAMEPELPDGMTLIFPDKTGREVPGYLKGNHRCIFMAEFVGEYKEAVETDSGSYAYMLFTSGSTGTPKGVPITHGNVAAYIDYLQQRYQPRPDDRFSQTFDLTFDLSVHDMFMAWAAGAALYCIPEKQLMMPAHYIRKHELSMWFSVPSMARYMDRFRLLKANAFPTLRFSLFCGEALPLAVAEAWAKAAPNSEVENIYGPTEATIGISHYRLDWINGVKERNGIVSMGKIFPEQEHIIMCDDATVLEGEGEGELCLGGTQLCGGYWQDEARSRELFFALDGRRYYRSGDLVFRDRDGDLFFISRLDQQVKIRGYRVELEEVSHALRTLLGGGDVVTVATGQQEGVAEGLICYVLSEYESGSEEMIPRLSRVLPDYMVPSEIRFVDSFPLNDNGKIDRRRLVSGDW